MVQYTSTDAPARTRTIADDSFDRPTTFHTPKNTEGAHTMPRSGRIRGRRPLQSPADVVVLPLLLLLLGLLAPATKAHQYDEALARRMIVYSSIAISEPEQVDSWMFPNPRESRHLLDFGRFKNPVCL